MRLEYDPEADALNIEFIPRAMVVDTIDRDGILVDLAEDGRLVAIEILDASARRNDAQGTHT